jgi:hypothetical protein
MIKYTLMIFLALAVSGCAAATRPGGVLYSHGQQTKLTTAVRFLEEGKTSDARKLLTGICSEKGVAGVTDEALFRLSLLRLESLQDKNSLTQAQHDLERLIREYPSSSWAPLASSLTEFLASADEGRQQNRKLKELNLSLTKENKELRQSIEQLKTLELELGRGPKR